MKNFKIKFSKYLKKTLIVLSKIALGLLGAYAVMMMIIIPYALDQIEAFEPAKAEKIVKMYNLKGDSPAAYGYDYEDITFTTRDNIELTGWYISAKEPSDKCIYFVHGWASSGLSCLQFLDIMRDKNLDLDHNLFIINLRNSGNSSKVRSDLGYKTSQDVMEGLRLLKHKYHINEVKMFSISMGALATLTAIHTNREEIIDLGISISKLILDSPLSNAKDSIQSFDSPLKILNQILYAPLFIAIEYRWDNMLEKLRLSYMLPKIDISKVLVIQSEKDKLTKLSTLEQELGNIPVKMEVFEQGAHARVYANNKREYSNLVSKFLSSSD